MARPEHDFDDDDCIRALLWCARHCCLCGEHRDIGIELAHLAESSNIDDGMPVCFDCHAKIGHYNAKHPRGRKYSVKELKARREQVYEKHTRHLVPPVHFRLVQGTRKLPDVGFEIDNLGNTYPVRARVTISLTQVPNILGLVDHAHYNGTVRWNLNPGFAVRGHFTLPASASIVPGQPHLRARVAVTLCDVHEREHQLLPVGYVLELSPGAEWFFEPSEEMFGPDPYRE